MRIKRVTSVGELDSVGQAAEDTLVSVLADRRSRHLRMIRSWLSFAFDGRRQQGVQRQVDKEAIVRRNDHTSVDVHVGKNSL